MQRILMLSISAAAMAWATSALRRLAETERNLCFHRQRHL